MAGKDFLPMTHYLEAIIGKIGGSDDTKNKTSLQEKTLVYICIYHKKNNFLKKDKLGKIFATYIDKMI